jgi:hypothetical protein
MRASIVWTIAAVIVLIVAVVYFVKKRSLDNPMVSVASSGASDSIPTPQYLFEHPDILKDAEQKCRDGGSPTSLYCSNVHRAESLRMADQYRRALKPKGAAQ